MLEGEEAVEVCAEGSAECSADFHHSSNIFIGFRLSVFCFIEIEIMTMN